MPAPYSTETPDTGVYVKDLTSFVVKGVAEIRQVLEVGKRNRTVGPYTTPPLSSST